MSGSGRVRVLKFFSGSGRVGFWNISSGSGRVRVWHDGFGSGFGFFVINIFPKIDPPFPFYCIFRHYFFSKFKNWKKFLKISVKNKKNLKKKILVWLFQWKLYVYFDKNTYFLYIRVFSGFRVGFAIFRVRVGSGL